jgi:hypothetical protein
LEYYFGADNFWHSFVRDASGTTTVFGDPDATKATGNGTYAWVINDKGEVGGFYNHNNITGINRTFVRDRLGNFRNFDAVSGILLKALAQRVEAPEARCNEESVYLSLFQRLGSAAPEPPLALGVCCGLSHRALGRWVRRSRGGRQKFDSLIGLST